MQHLPPSERVGCASSTIWTIGWFSSVPGHAYQPHRLAAYSLGVPRAMCQHAEEHSFPESVHNISGSIFRLCGDKSPSLARTHGGHFVFPAPFQTRKLCSVKGFSEAARTAAHFPLLVGMVYVLPAIIDWYGLPVASLTAGLNSIPITESFSVMSRESSRGNVSCYYRNLGSLRAGTRHHGDRRDHCLSSQAAFSIRFWHIVAGSTFYTASRACRICMLRDNWLVNWTGVSQ